MAINIPNGHKIYQHFPFQGPPKFTQMGIFGLKNHLASLATSCSTAAKPFFKSTFKIFSKYKNIYHSRTEGARLRFFTFPIASKISAEGFLRFAVLKPMPRAG
jgi:hypothetical protein